MEIWKRNWLVCWFVGLIVAVGMSQMAPMLPLYIAHLGIRDVGEITKWSGIVYGSNFISLAIFSPIWDRFAINMVESEKTVSKISKALQSIIIDWSA